MAKIDRPCIVAGNDTTLYIQLKEFQNGEYVDFDLNQVTDLKVELICAKDNYIYEIPFHIDEQYSNLIICDLKYTQYHTNTSYGIRVTGKNSDDKHFTWCMMPREGFIVVSNTSGLHLTDETQQLSFNGLVGWGISKYVNADWDENDPTEAGYIKNKPDIDGMIDSALENYYDKTETDALLEEKADTSDLDDYYNKGEVDGMLNNKVDTSTLNSDYYNKNTVDNLLDAKADTSDLNNYYDKTQTDTLLNQKADTSDLNNKQDTLISGTNIKTINNQSLLGSGNIDIQGGGTQVQANWAETDTSDPSYIQNKPFVPYDQYGNLLVQGYTGSNIITNNILSGSNSIMGDLYNSILGGSGNIIGARQFINWNLNQNIMLGWQCSIDNVHTSLIIGENCNINTPASGALIIGQDNIVYNTSWHTDIRNREPIFILGKGNKMGYNTDGLGWNIANKYMIGNYLTCEGDRDPGLYIGQYNKYFYLDQNNDPVYVPYDDALLTVGNGQFGANLNALILDEHNQLYIQPYNSNSNNDNIYEDVDGMINVAKQLASLTPYDYSTDYFTIVSLEDNNTISWKTNDSSYNKDISVSTDNGSTWTQYTSSVSGTVIATLNTDDKVLIKGSNASYGTASYYCNINTSNTCKVEGNIMSLIYGDNFKGQTSLTETYTFRNLFGSNNFTSAENLVLPATTLTNYCYYRMFIWKSNLQIPPKELPAITLSTSSYEEMFAYCSSLTIAPVIKATVGANSCCKKMFMMCSSLTKAPDLLFDDMMYVIGGFVSMFENCTSLNFVKCLASSTSLTHEYDWLLGVSATGTFIKKDNTSWSRGSSGIPTGWNVYNASQDVPAMKYDIPASPVQSNWNESDSSSLAYIQNKPTIPAAPVQSDWNESDSSSLAYIQNKPTIPAAQVQSDWNQSDNTAVDYIKNKPTSFGDTNYDIDVMWMLSQEWQNGAKYCKLIIDNIAVKKDNVVVWDSYTDFRYYNSIDQILTYIENTYGIGNKWQYDGYVLGQIPTFTKDLRKYYISLPSSSAIAGGKKLNYGDTLSIQFYYNSNSNNTFKQITIPLLSAGSVTSSTTGMKIEVVAALPANPDTNTIYLCIASS